MKKPGQETPGDPAYVFSVTGAETGASHALPATYFLRHSNLRLNLLFVFLRIFIDHVIGNVDLLCRMFVARRRRASTADSRADPKRWQDPSVQDEPGNRHTDYDQCFCHRCCFLLM